MKTVLISLLSLLVLCMTLSGQKPGSREEVIRRNAEKSLELCMDLHSSPELSFMETGTAAKLAAALRLAGFEVREQYGGNNVVGIFRNGDGPVILLRTDMDALPVEEKTGLEFASRVKAVDINGNTVPVMHACGHDIHMSVWLGTIRSLVELKKSWKGTLLVIAQQAEEMSGGAGAALENGLYRDYPVPDLALAFHINPALGSGQIGLVPGPVFAGVRSARITVYGKGGHGAYPEKCIDPVVIAARIILDIQTIVSRELSPLEPVVVTVGSIHGGTRPNIIPDEVNMELTLRYYSDEAIERVIAALERISTHAALMSGMPADRIPLVLVDPNETPPVINDPGLTARIRSIAENELGRENVLTLSPEMVGEDFGRYGRTAEEVPVCLIWLGSTDPDLLRKLEEEGKEPAPLHSPYLDPDYKKTITTGIRVMVSNVIDLMGSAD
ncbi:MAG: M20 metallopeptidase family protein [Bacteroidota bacterium]